MASRTFLLYRWAVGNLASLLHLWLLEYLRYAFVAAMQIAVRVRKSAANLSVTSRGIARPLYFSGV
eukprot:5947210-Pleurochrysis_carterae.AAC.1